MKRGVKAVLCMALLWLCLAAPAAYAVDIESLTKAAEQGDAAAQSLLGLLYVSGVGVPQDYGQAANWFRKAAEQGDAMAQGNLGAMYDGGQGVPQDYIQAHMWFNLAAASSSPVYAEARKKAADLRDGLAAKMTPAQIAEAQRLAREWKPKLE